MKVLYILDEIRYSGLEMMLDNSFEYWNHHGIEIDILATGINKGEAYDTLEDKGYTLLHISFQSERFKSFRSLRKLLLVNMYDVVHIHTEANFLLHAMNAYLTGNKCIVRTFHSLFRPKFLGKMRRLFDRCIAHLIGVKYVSVGDSVAQNERDKYLTTSKVIYNWYDNNKFFRLDCEKRAKLRVKLEIKKNVFVICSVGNCSIIKQHDVILYALAKLPKSVDWLYLHVGRENMNCDERILAKKLGIYSQCSFLGSVTNVSEILAVSDVYVMSSKLEGLSIAAMESIAVGTPTVLSKVPGLNDILKLVPETVGYFPNSDDLSLALLDIYKLSIEERILMSEGLAARALELFSISKGVSNYVKYYTNVINESFRK